MKEITQERNNTTFFRKKTAAKKDNVVVKWLFQSFLLSTWSDDVNGSRFPSFLSKKLTVVVYVEALKLKSEHESHKTGVLKPFVPRKRKPFRIVQVYLRVAEQSTGLSADNSFERKQEHQQKKLLIKGQRIDLRICFSQKMKKSFIHLLPFKVENKSFCDERILWWLR